MKKKWKEYECCVESCLESDVCNLWPRYLWRSHFHQHFSSLKSKNMPKLWPISAKWPKWKVSEKAWSQFYGKTTLTQQQAREHSSRCWKTSERKTLDEFCFSRVSYECNITNIKHSMDDDQLNWHGTSTFFSSKLGYVLATTANDNLTYLPLKLNQTFETSKHYHHNYKKKRRQLQENYEQIKYPLPLRS